MEKDKESFINPGDQRLTYGSYLKIDNLLNLQAPLSDPSEQDEMLFILIHQVYELWFKQILHEIKFTIQSINSDRLMPALRTLTRVHTIQDTLIKQVDILETMTPNDFNRFRDRLNPASGFQSAQFRVLEYLLGAKQAQYLKFHEHTPDVRQILEEALAAPTLYDSFLHLLHRRGFAVPNDVLNRDTSLLHACDQRVVAVFLEIYRNSDQHYDLYMMLESFADLDEKFLLWRYRHVAMVERMIGNKMGTGGSSGVKYLSSTLSKRFFPEVWELRNHLSTES